MRRARKTDVGEQGVEDLVGRGPGKGEPLPEAEVDQPVPADHDLESEEPTASTRGHRSAGVDAPLDGGDEQRVARPSRVLRPLFGDARRRRRAEEHAVMAGVPLGEVEVGQANPPQRLERVVHLGPGCGQRRAQLGPPLVEDGDEQRLLVGEVQVDARHADTDPLRHGAQ